MYISIKCLPKDSILVIFSVTNSIYFYRKGGFLPKKGINIFKRKDGRWEARYVKGYDANGKKKYGSVYGKTFEEAKLKQEEHTTKNSVESENCMLLNAIMNLWISEIKLAVKKSTFQKYESIIRNHIKPHAISKTNIKMINTRIIYEFSMDLSNYYNLSAKTVNDTLVVLGLILKYVEDLYGIPKPKIKYQKVIHKEMRVLSIEEQARLENFLYNDINNYKFGILLALYTGIRLGELCALQWSDIESDRIRINKSVQRIKNGNKTSLEISLPKTQKSIRTVPLPNFLTPIIEKRRGTGYVIKNRNEKMVEPRLMQMTFEKYIVHCGLPKTNFHALRHTFATRCIEVGFDIKTLSEILGHSDVKTTLNRYVHSSMIQKQKYMDYLKPVGKL